jgi:acid phosphatase type 7
LVTKRHRRLVRAIVALGLAFATGGIIYHHRFPSNDTTPPPAHTVTEVNSADPVVAAAGDIACSADEVQAPKPGECRMDQTAALLAAIKPAAVLTLGDEQYETGQLADFNAVYQPTWGVYKSITHPAIGNHEYGTASLGSAAGYFDYFGTTAGNRDQGYYSFDLGAWHIVALNANCTRVGCGSGSAQERWLKQDLAAHTNRCVMALWHQPRFSSGIEHGNDKATDAFWRDLYAAHADLVLNGHDHDYERFTALNPDQQTDPNGLTEMVIGTGGRNLYSFRTQPQPGSQVRHSAYGVLKLTLHTQSYDWQWVGLPGDDFTDAGSANCS